MSDDARDVLFRGAISGYNKNDVNEYIEKMNSDFQIERIRLIREAEKAEKEAATACENAEKNLQRMKNAASESMGYAEKARMYREELEAANKRINELEGELKQLHELSQSQNDALDEMCTELSRLKELENDNDKDDDLIEKANCYDDMSSQIGQVLIDAKKEAENTVARAKCEAEQIIANARKQALEMSHECKNKICDMYKSYFKACTGSMQSIKEKIVSLVDEIDEKELMLDNLCDDVSDKTHQELFK